jgi:hypothetical protein
MHGGFCRYVILGASAAAAAVTAAVAVQRFAMLRSMCKALQGPTTRCHAKRKNHTTGCAMHAYAATLPHLLLLLLLPVFFQRH